MRPESRQADASFDRMLDALGTRPRRRTLVALLGHNHRDDATLAADVAAEFEADRAAELEADRAAELETDRAAELETDRAAELETDLAVGLARGGTESAMRDRLRHVDLPKLVDAGYVDWDREAGWIRRGPRFDEVRPLLALLVRHGDDLPDDWL